MAIFIRLPHWLLLVGKVFRSDRNIILNYTTQRGKKKDFNEKTLKMQKKNFFVNA